MTVTRSSAPSNVGAGEAAPPPFPMWPYAFTAYADHCSRDYGDYLDRLAKADDAVAVIQAEETLGLNLLTDMNQAFYALIWNPWRAAMASAGGRTSSEL
jgi:hypothetical protein